MNSVSKCGYIAIIGRPNVGKSTLLNKLLNKKISITSSKPQTTRSQILGIKTQGLIQEVFIDTPGIHQSEKKAMNRYMNHLANSVILDADIILFLIETTRWHEEDELILAKLKNAKAPVLLVINKVDKIKDKKQLLPFIEKIQTKFQFKELLLISALKDKNVSEIEKEIVSLLPEGPHLFPEEQVTDKTDRFQVAELIREKVIRSTGQEVPYSTTIEIESLKIENKIIHISAIIWVEREGQKAIVIGKEGERLKAIATSARKDIERFLNEKVFLRVWVKVSDKLD